jgi:[ribosomal protein S5]-alanine N-acetyltransferase
MAASELHLLTLTLEHRIAFQQGSRRLGELLDVTVPADWPMFPVAFRLPTGDPPRAPGWPSYLFISAAHRALVGNGGFTGPPDESGNVEIGYEIAPAFQNQGFATAAVSQMLGHAFAQPGVIAVVAHTLAQPNASNAVLQKLGAEFESLVPHDSLGTVWRWRIPRPSAG